MTAEDGSGPDGVDAAQVQELTALARSVTAEDRRRDAVPDDLWRSIEAELAPTNQGAGEVRSIEVRARRRWKPLAAVAAAAAIVVGVVGITVTGDDGGGDVVARADLAALMEGFEGSAQVAETDGGLELTLEIGDLPADDGFYELWLIKDLETGQMQSLGPIDGSGTIGWPDGFDPAEYAVVDISIEPRDGVPTHSGVSVLRGTLES